MEPTWTLKRTNAFYNLCHAKYRNMKEMFKIEHKKEHTLHMVADFHLSLTWKASFSTVTLPWSLNAEGRKWYWIFGCDIPSLLRMKPPASRCAVAHGPVRVRNHLTPIGTMFHHLRERYKLKGCVHSWNKIKEEKQNLYKVTRQSFLLMVSLDVWEL